MRYFVITSGLRGCYMPDNCFRVAVKTRRELREAIAGEAEHQDCDGMMVGLTDRNAASLAALAWRSPNFGLPYALPFGHKPDRIGERPDYAFGIFISEETRREYLEQKDSDE